MSYVDAKSTLQGVHAHIKDLKHTSECHEYHMWVHGYYEDTSSVMRVQMHTRGFSSLQVNGVSVSKQVLRQVCI